MDVGTASVRAGLFDAAGGMTARAVIPTAIHTGPGGVAEQATAQVWAAAGRAIREALTAAGAGPGRVRGLAFDATCSLVLSDRAGAPLALGPEGRDILLWFDHRAAEEAGACTATGHPVLRTLGGSMSPEMQVPKLLWVKRRRPDLWSRLGSARDLTDWLGWRATGQEARSLCTLAAKWTWGPGGVPGDFLAALGLDDLPERAGLGHAPRPPGAVLGPLGPEAASELGLTPGIAVAVGLVDAHAGALATMGAEAAAGATGSAALIAGTSACVMTLTPAPWHAAGVWGPFADAILPGLFVNEGGQSAAGALLDAVLAWHPGLSHDAVQARIAVGLAREGPDYGDGLDVLPDLNGNRTPLADPALRGVITGLSLDRTDEGIARLYWRAAVGLALGMREIVGHMARHGPVIDRLAVCGGHARAPLLMQLLADATGRSVHVAGGDGVLLGSAMAAATAAGAAPDLAAAARMMAPRATVLTPDPAMAARLDRDARVFAMMQAHRSEIAILRARG